MKLTFEFQIKRGVVNEDDFATDECGVLKECLQLCENGNHDRAVDLLMPKLRFEWDWSNCDGDIDEFIPDAESLDLECNPENCSLQVDAQDGHLVITATVVFDYETVNEINIQEFAEWLDENSAYACGFVSGGWGYDGSDGDNVWLVKVDGREVELG